MHSHNRWIKTLLNSYLVIKSKIKNWLFYLIGFYSLVKIEWMQWIFLHCQFSLSFLEQPRTSIFRTRLDIYSQISYSILFFNLLNSSDPLSLLLQRSHLTNRNSQPAAINVIIPILDNEICLSNKLNQRWI